jgi:hypothetical protein
VTLAKNYLLKELWRFLSFGVAFRRCLQQDVVLELDKLVDRLNTALLEQSDIDQVLILILPLFFR